MQTVLCTAASESRGEEGQRCLMVFWVLKAICCILSHILKLVPDFILRCWEPKSCYLRQAPGESKDTALVSNVGYGAMYQFCFRYFSFKFLKCWSELTEDAMFVSWWDNCIQSQRKFIFLFYVLFCFFTELQIMLKSRIVLYIYRKLWAEIRSDVCMSWNWTAINWLIILPNVFQTGATENFQNTFKYFFEYTWDNQKVFGRFQCLLSCENMSFH